MLPNACCKVILRYSGALILMLSLAACSTLRPTNWKSDPHVDSATIHPVTMEVRIVSDSQIHESRGIPSRYLSLAGDEAIAVTIRSGQQVIGAADLLKVAMTDYYPLTLHLGDAIDLSCQSEWHRFMRVMQEKGKPGATTWLLAQGNHDGFLAGNISPGSSGVYVDEYWNNMCNARGVVGSDDVDTSGKRANEKNFAKKKTLATDYYANLKNGMGSRVEVHDDMICDGNDLCAAHVFENEWKSFVVQLVKIPAHKRAEGANIYALLLDSSDFNDQLSSPFGKIRAGERGGITAGQSRKALELIKRMPANSSFFIVSHHPYADWKIESWTAEDVAAMKSVMDDPGFMNFILSAHSHEGGWYTHRFQERSLYELNTGSLADAPLYYRTLQFERDTLGGFIVHSRPILLKTDHYPTCAKVHSPAPGSGYTAEEQKSVFERNGNKGFAGRLAAGVSSAAKHLVDMWEAKHTELKPQLLAYADVVHAVSKDLTLPTPNGRCSGPDDLPKKMACLAVCFDGKECSVDDKGKLLLALDNYYWDKTTDADIRRDAHQLRYCMAAKIANESAEPVHVDAVLRNVEGNTRRLPLPEPTGGRPAASNALRQP